MNNTTADPAQSTTVIVYVVRPTTLANMHLPSLGRCRPSPQAVFSCMGVQNVDFFCSVTLEFQLVRLVHVTGEKPS